MKNKKVMEQEELLNSLRSLVPNVSRSTDKADVLSGAVSYINELQTRVEELESKLEREAASENNSEETGGSSREEGRVVEVEVKAHGEDQAVVRVESRNLSYAGARLMGALRDLGLKVLHGNMSNLEDAITVQSVVVELAPTGLGSNHEAIKQALVTKLQLN